jgi:hemolysin activation/secretion protein
VTPSEPTFDRRARQITHSLALTLGIGIALVETLGATIAQAEVSLPRLPPSVDPTGRSNEPPPLFEELPRSVPAPGQIQPPVPPPGPLEPGLLPRIKVRVQRIDVVGSTVFTPAEIAKVTDDYIGKEVTAEDLEALRVALTRLYINRGYVNSGAILPDQTVAEGVIAYRIIEGKLSDTQIRGNRWLRAEYYRDRVALSTRPPLNVNALQERLQLLLEDSRIERLNAELKPGSSPAEALLDLRVEERFPLRLTFDFDNYQSPSIGAQRGVVTFEHQSLTGNADPLALSYGRSQGLDPLLDFSYAIPITARDTTLGAQYRRNDLTVVEQPFTPLDIQSGSETYTLFVRQPVYRTPSTSVSLELIGERSALSTSVSGDPFNLEAGAVKGHAAVTAARLAQEFVYRTLRHIRL